MVGGPWHGSLPGGLPAACDGVVHTAAPQAAVTVVSVAAGSFHTMALTAAGAVFTYGAMATPAGSATATQARSVAAEAGGGARAQGRVLSIAAGDENSIAVTADGAVCTWGSATFHQLGHGDTADDPAAADGV